MTLPKLPPPQGVSQRKPKKLLLRERYQLKVLPKVLPKVLTQQKKVKTNLQNLRTIKLKTNLLMIKQKHRQAVRENL